MPRIKDVQNIGTLQDTDCLPIDRPGAYAANMTTVSDIKQAIARADNIVNLGDVAGTQVIDMSLGTIFIASATAPCTWSFINPQDGFVAVTLKLYNGSLFGQVFENVSWSYGFAPNLTELGTDILEFLSTDNWATIDGFISARNLLPVTP